MNFFLLATINVALAMPTDNDINQQLIDAAKIGNEMLVKDLLTNSAIDINANEKGFYGQTALTSAAKNGHDKVVELLLKNSAIDVNKKNTGYFMQSPLMLAAKNGHEKIAELLIQNSGDSHFLISCRQKWVKKNKVMGYM